MNQRFYFDRVIDRQPEHSDKWSKYQGQDILPFWVADMDFQAAPSILAALKKRIEYGVFGYPQRPHLSLNQAFQTWLAKNYNWKVDTGAMLWKTGMVPFLHSISRIFSLPSNKVIVPVPVYYHLFLGPELGGQETIYVPHLVQGGKYSLDLNKIEEGLKQGSRLIMLSNPLNPVGRCLEAQELAALADLAEKYDALICSDEIHADLVLAEGKKHIPIATLKESYKDRLITLMGPTKAFNIPGLGISCAVVENPELFKKLDKGTTGLIHAPSALAIVAAEEAYRNQEAHLWLTELIHYLRGNRDLLSAFFKERSDRFWVVDPIEATYLAWVKPNFLAADQILETFEKAGVGISDGASFRGPGYFRLNFGCPRSTLEKGLERIDRIRPRK